MRGRPLTVIIPYYQAEQGILARAIESIAAQSIAKDVDLIIVDDGSPVPATGELSGALPFYRCRILRQPNRGVGAARNTGLAAIHPSAEVIAFLDSDDEWTDIHLERACHALRMGADVYFSKVRVLDDPNEDAPDRWPGPTLTARAVPDAEEMHFLTEGAVAYTLQYGLPIQSLVFRRAIAPQLRFATDVHHAGEDLQFTFALVTATTEIAYSSRAEVVLGRGVNIYRSTVGHGAEHAIARIADQVRTRMTIGARLPDNSSQAFLNKSILKRLASDLALQILHAARKGKLMILSRAFFSLLRWPQIWPSLVLATLRHTEGKLRSRRRA
jgi:succinoglycan biosynthesis protein ExoW